MIKKKWTVIMYLNGNNELAIEMENTFKDVCNVKSDDTNIVIQISKAPIEIVNLIRQDKSSYQEDWVGTRRYSLVDGKLELKEELPNLNMADYKSLYKF